MIELLIIASLGAIVINVLMRRRTRDYYVVEHRVMLEDGIRRIHSWHLPHYLDPLHLGVLDQRVRWRGRRRGGSVDVMAKNSSEPIAYRHLTAFDDYFVAQQIFRSIPPCSLGNGYSPAESRYLWVVSAKSQIHAAHQLAMGAIKAGPHAIEETPYQDILRQNEQARQMAPD